MNATASRKGEYTLLLQIYIYIHLTAFLYCLHFKSKIKELWIKRDYCEKGTWCAKNECQRKSENIRHGAALILATCMTAKYERLLRIDIYETNVNVALCEISWNNNNPFNRRSSNVCGWHDNIILLKYTTC